MAESAISFYNPDGSLKSKDQIVEDVCNLYDSCSHSYTDTIDYLATCIGEENQINIDSTLKTFNFISKSITIDGEITQETAKSVVEQIRFWNAVNKSYEMGPITLYINSEGGDLHATLSIIGAIEVSKVPIYTVNIGRAWSGGFLILISGDKRFATPYASYLFHEGSNCIIGDAHKTIQEMEFYNYQLKIIKQIVLKNTDIGEELYESHEKDDWWLGNKDALKYNIINAIIQDFETFKMEGDDTDEG